MHSAFDVNCLQEEVQLFLLWLASLFQSCRHLTGIQEKNLKPGKVQDALNVLKLNSDEVDLSSGSLRLPEVLLPLSPSAVVWRSKVFQDQTKYVEPSDRFLRKVSWIIPSCSHQLHWSISREQCPVGLWPSLLWEGASFLTLVDVAQALTFLFLWVFFCNYPVMQWIYIFFFCWGKGWRSFLKLELLTD